MKNKRALLFTSMSALIFLILFKPSLTLAKNPEIFHTSVASLGVVERTTDTGQDPEPEPEPNPGPGTNPEPEPEGNPPPVPQEPETGKKPGEDTTSKPEQDKDSNTDKDSTSKPSQNTKPETSKPDKAPIKPQNPRPNQNTNNSNSWTNPNRNNGMTTPTREPLHTQPTNTVQPINEEQNDLPIEEVESEDVNIAEEELKVELAQYSVKELIKMMESGEITGEVIGDKYFVISKETEEQREMTKEEALKLGILEAEEEEPTEEIEEDASEVMVEPAPEAIKSERTKTPLYVSAVGLAIIIVGSLMYFLQLRRTRN